MLLGHVTGPRLPPRLPDPSAPGRPEACQQGPALVGQVKAPLSTPPCFLPPSPGSLSPDVPQVASPGFRCLPTSCLSCQSSPCFLEVLAAEALPMVRVLPGSSDSLVPQALLFDLKGSSVTLCGHLTPQSWTTSRTHVHTHWAPLPRILRPQGPRGFSHIVSLGQPR